MTPVTVDFPMSYEDTSILREALIDHMVYWGDKIEDAPAGSAAVDAFRHQQKLAHVLFDRIGEVARSTEWARESTSERTGDGPSSKLAGFHPSGHASQPIERLLCTDVGCGCAQHRVGDDCTLCGNMEMHRSRMHSALQRRGLAPPGD